MLQIGCYNFATKVARAQSVDICYKSEKERDVLWMSGSEEVWQMYSMSLHVRISMRIAQAVLRTVHVFSCNASFFA